MDNWGIEKPPFGTPIDLAWVKKWGNVLFMTMNGGGLIEPDLSGNGNNGTLTNMSFPPTATSGRVGDGVVLDGDDDYVNCGTIAKLQLQTFTVSAWFQWDSVHPDDIYRAILAKSNNDGNGYKDNYKIYVLDSDQKIYASVGKANGTEAWTIGSNTVVSSGRWYYVAVSFDSSGNMNLYVNGVSDATPVAVGLPYAATGNFTIGLWKTNWFYGEWDGLIGDVRIFNQALSPDEVAHQAVEPYYMVPKPQLIVPKPKIPISIFQQGQVI